MTTQSQLISKKPYSYEDILTLIRKLDQGARDTSEEHHIKAWNDFGHCFDVVVFYDSLHDCWTFKETLIPEIPTEIKNKIIVVIYHSGLTKWYPFTLENMETLVFDFQNIDDIQIIEQGE